MNTTAHTCSPLRQRMIEDMRMRKLVPRTQEGYIRAVRKLTVFLKRSPDTAIGDIRCPELVPRMPPLTGRVPKAAVVDGRNWLAPGGRERLQSRGASLNLALARPGHLPIFNVCGLSAGED